MNYQASLHFLESLFNFEKLSLSQSPEWNLARMRLLLKWAGNPEKSYFPVLIAGTKGKGSTGFFLESILNASGVPAGFYSSPHLETPRERIRLAGKMISKDLWARDMAVVQRVLSKHSLPKHLGQVTYFEAMTLLAALAFKRQGVEVGIFEVGMGGRLDATNAIDHQLAILTPIHLDHEAVLGNTIAKIAREKAAIIRPKSHVVVAPQVPEAMREIEKQVRKMKSKRYQVPQHPLRYLVPSGLKGDFQRINASAAQKAAEILKKEFGFKVTASGVQKGLQTQAWPGRFELLNIRSASWILDGAHNPISIEALVRNLKAHYANRPRTLIFGTSRDKNSAEMLRILSGYFNEILLTRATSSRSAEVASLMTQASGKFERIYPFGKASEALEFAKRKSLPGNLVVITGSFYLIGEARKFLCLKSI